MLKFCRSEAQALQAMAAQREVETCATALVIPAGQRDGEQLFVARTLTEVPDSAYATRTPTAAVLRPEYCIELANAARAAGAGVLLAHTHTGPHPLEGFSSVDDQGEPPLAQYFGRRVAAGQHFAAVFTSSRIHARQLGLGKSLGVTTVGDVLTHSDAASVQAEARYDRQARAFGQDGQQRLRTTRVAIVGLGGTGSVVAQQLAHLGVADFVLIDPDVVEATNLNRLVGAVASDVGAPKVQVASRQILAINPAANVLALEGDIVEGTVAALLKAVDFSFGCTDSMASRAVLNQLAYQYLVPCIDVGVGIFVQDGQVQYVAGRTQMLSPGLPCLVCTDKLDGEQVRREMMTEAQRKLDPYITGAAIPQPAVISLNSTMSSAAVTMFLAAVTAMPSQARMLTYDGLRGSLRPAAMAPRAHCIVCSPEGASARGDTWQLPTRTTEPK